MYYNNKTYLYLCNNIQLRMFIMNYYVYNFAFAVFL